MCPWSGQRWQKPLPWARLMPLVWRSGSGRNLEDLRANWQADKTWQPHMPQAQRDTLYQGWLKAVERTFDWVE